MPLFTPSFLDGQHTSGSNAGRSRAFNRSLVLSKVRAAGTSGRAEIARDSGLSTQAVSNIIGELVNEGWLYEAGKRSQGRGLPAVQYAISPDAGTALGMEVRPAAILTSLVGLNGQTQFTHRQEITRADPKTLAKLIPQLRDQALQKAGSSAPKRLLGAGVVMPGPFGATGLSGADTDLPGWSDVDPQALFQDWLGLPVTIENDANAGAMTERVLGVAQGISAFAYLYFGTGLGLGVVSNGAVQRGAFGNAGEIGHIQVPYQGRLQPLEQAVSRMALQARMAKIGRKADRIEDLDLLLEEQHPDLLNWLDEAAPALSHAIHTIENLLDPQTIVLGGAISDTLLKALMDRLTLTERSVSNRPTRDHPRLLVGACGRMTAPRGAAALVINTALTPHMTALA